MESAGPRTDYESVLRRGFLTTDSRLLSEMTAENSGATAVALLLKDGTVTVANAGDCRAVSFRHELLGCYGVN
jgi:serine/threonine protein phosphatase PrpC